MFFFIFFEWSRPEGTKEYGINFKKKLLILAFVVHANTCTYYRYFSIFPFLAHCSCVPYVSKGVILFNKMEGLRFLCTDYRIPTTKQFIHHSICSLTLLTKCLNYLFNQRTFWHFCKISCEST